jgi:hypothetical protein
MTPAVRPTVRPKSASDSVRLKDGPDKTGRYDRTLPDETGQNRTLFGRKRWQREWPEGSRAPLLSMERSISIDDDYWSLFDQSMRRCVRDRRELADTRQLFLVADFNCESCSRTVMHSPMLVKDRVKPQTFAYVPQMSTPDRPLVDASRRPSSNVYSSSARDSRRWRYGGCHGSGDAERRAHQSAAAIASHCVTRLHHRRRGRHRSHPMNPMNLKRLQLYGAIVRGLEGTGTKHHPEVWLPNGRLIGFARPPSLTSSDKFTASTAGLNDPERMEFVDDEVSLLAIRSLMPLAKVAGVVAAMKKDTHLSDAGKRVRIVEAGAAAVRAVSEQAAALRKAETENSNMEVTLFDEPLKLRSDDHIGIARDRELRDRFLKVDGQVRPQAMRHLFESTLREQVAGALLRSPFAVNDVIAKRAKDTWRAVITERMPDKVAAWRAQSEGIEWTRAVIGTAAAVTAEIADLQPRDIYKAAHAGGGIHVFGISDPQQRQFAHELAVAA